jgi:hypothetical protein
MAAAVASHLVKVDPGTAGWWISLAYSIRRSDGVEKAEAILLRAQATHPKVAMIGERPPNSFLTKVARQVGIDEKV